MPKLTIQIDIDIQNYDEIGRGKVGVLAGLVNKISYGQSFLRKKVDAEVEKRIISGLANELPQNLKTSLEENGVKAIVKVQSES